MRLPSGSRATAIAIVAVALWTAWWASRAWAVSGLSWHYFADGSRLLTGGSGFHLYAEHPELQTGPLSLAVAALGHPLPAAAAQKVALVAMTAAGPLLLAILVPVVDPARRAVRVLLAGLVLAPAWTVLSVRWGHLDDVLAMAAAVLAIRALHAGRPVLTGLALAAGVACKPWALGFFPLLLALPASGWVWAAAAAATGTAIAWLPFVVADPATLTAMHPNVALVPSSGLHTLGVRGTVVPSWGRTAQLLGETAVAAIAGLTGRWPGVLLVAVAVRLALDPQDNAYYLGSAALAAVVFDLLGTRWTIPWTSLVTVLVLWQPFVTDYAHRMTTTSGLTHWWFAHPTEVGAAHLAWSIAVVVLVLVMPGQTLKRNDHAGYRWPLINAGRGWKTRSDLHKRVLEAVGRRRRLSSSAGLLADCLRTAQSYVGRVAPPNHRARVPAPARGRSRFAEDREPDRSYRAPRATESCRTTLGMTETAGQSSNCSLAIVGRSRRFLDVVLPQCCPKAMSTKLAGAAPKGRSLAATRV